MRDIKFRVWDGINMYYLDDNSKIVLEFNKISGWNLRSNKIGINEKYITGECSSGIFDIMQYTGLKDKNGKEIYEGDIVMYSDKSTPLVVGFENGSFVLNKDGKTYVYNINPKELEVIGNIHENKDLI